MNFALQNERSDAAERDELTEYVRQVACGDSDAMMQLHDRTRQLVYSLVLRILRKPDEAEEVALDVYTQIWKTASRYDARRGSVLAWIVTMARTRALDRLSSRRARPDIGGCPVDVLPLAGPSAGVDSLLARRQVVRLLQALHPEERRLIELAFFEGFTHSELAARLQLPLGTVKTRIRSALLKMRFMEKL
jgi:RNA polymerase sigma-70 factor (ECF subfamily)